MATDDKLEFEAVTIKRSKEFQLKWTINDFSLYMCEGEGEGKHHTSPVFQLGFNGKYLKSAITIMSYDYSEKILHANLEFIEQPHVRFKPEYILFNSLGEELKVIQVASRVTSSHRYSNSCLKTDYVPVIELTKLFKEISHDDTLILICKLKVSPIINEPKIVSVSSVPIRESSILNDFKKLRINKDLSDMTISVGSRKFHVHRSIVGGRSSVFASMFRQVMIEAKTAHVKINDIDPNVFDGFLDFVYTGKADFDKYDALELLPVADKYDVQDLKRICEDVLINKITKENCIEILLFSDLHTAASLKKRAMEFICENSSDFSENDFAPVEDKSLILSLTKMLINRKF